jgi:S-layer protein
MSATVIYANLGLSASALGAANYTTAVTAATTDARVYANGAVSAAQAAQTDTEFAAATMSNLGMSAAIIGQAAYDALLPAYAAYLASVGVANRGVVVVQLASIVAGLTADATFGNAAKNLVNASNAASIYSTNAANTTDKAINVATEPAVVTTFALTISADNFPGTALADIFSGVASTLSSANTFNATDKINGGEGADALNLTLNTNFTGFTTGSVASVETVSLTNGSAGARAFSAKGMTGVATYKIDANDAQFDLTNLASIPAIELTNTNGSSAGNFTASFAVETAPLTGTADAMSIALSNVGKAKVAATDTAAAVNAVPATLTLTSIETANVSVSGTTVDVDFGGTLKAINVTGAAATTIAVVPGTLTSFDASAATGAVTATLTGAGTTANTLASVSTGSGADTVTVDEVDLTANATLAGGEGADTLTLDSNGGVVQYKMSGFETLALNTVSGALTVSALNTTGMTTISSVAGTAAAVTVANLGAADLAVTAVGVTDDAGDITTDNTGASVLNYTAEAASVKAKTVQAPLADYTFSAGKNLTVNVGAYTDNTGSTVTAASATSLAVNVASGKDSAATPAELTEFGGTVTVAKATSIVVNAEGKIDGATISAAAATTANITNGTSAAGLTLTAAKLEVLNVTSGNSFDLLNGGGTDSTLTGVQVADVNIAKGTFTATGLLTAMSDLKITGAGTATGSESTATLGGLGGNNAYSMNVTASGLKGGFTTTSMNVAAGQNITADLNGVTGNISLGTVGNGQAGKDVNISATNAAGTFAVGNIAATGAVVLNTAGAKKTVSIGTVTTDGAVKVTNSSTGTFGLGNVNANTKGDVSVQLDGTVGAVTIGTFAGKSVTVDASDTIGGVVGPTVNSTTTNTFSVTALTAADVSVSSLQASQVSITAATGSTALAVALTGGSLVDTVTVTGVTTSTSLTLTGALGLGTDKVTVDGTNYNGSATQTISVAGLATYDAAALNGSGVKDVIIGGSGVDTIKGGAGQDTLTGGAGADIFFFAGGDSDTATFDTITDFGTTDIIRVSGVTISRAGDENANGASATVAKIVNGVADFTGITAREDQDTLSEKVGILAGQLSAEESALFQHDGNTYVFIETTTGNDLVIALTGVVLAFTTATASGDGTQTGLFGFGA